LIFIYISKLIGISCFSSNVKLEDTISEFANLKHLESLWVIYICNIILSIKKKKISKYIIQNYINEEIKKILLIFFFFKKKFNVLFERILFIKVNWAIKVGVKHQLVLRT